MAKYDQTTFAFCVIKLEFKKNKKIKKRTHFSCEHAFHSYFLFFRPYADNFAIMSVKIAKIAPSIIVSFDKSASMPPALPPNTVSAAPPMEPPMPALLPDCNTIVAIKPTAIIASITINTVNNSNTPPTFLSVLFYHSEKLCAMISFLFSQAKEVCPRGADLRSYVFISLRMRGRGHRRGVLLLLWHRRRSGDGTCRSHRRRYSRLLDGYDRRVFRRS